jgi:hypothetical protein
MPGTIGPLANGAGEEAKHLSGNLPSLSVSHKDTNGHSTPRIKDQRRNLSDDDRAVLALRNLIFDLCNHNGGGHGGSAIGMAAIGVALYKHVMRYNPTNPDWFDRDRFVLSNGKSTGHNDTPTVIKRFHRTLCNVPLCIESFGWD